MNFSCEYGAGQALTVLGRTNLKVNGTATALSTSGSGRVILGTKAKDVVPGFDGVSDAALTRMAKDSDTFFFVGSHYLTQGTPAEATAAANALGRSLEVMRAANPKLVRHLQYVVPKQAATEAAVMSALIGHTDSLSMNAVELPGLLARLGAAGHTAVVVDEHQHRDRSEEPAGMVEGAVALTQAMQLGRVHLHGLLGDLIVVDDKGPGGEVDVDRTRLALLRARQLASVKAANASGEITGAHEVFDVAPVVEGKCLAAVQRFADAVAVRYGLSDAGRQPVAADPAPRRALSRGCPLQRARRRQQHRSHAEPVSPRISFVAGGHASSDCPRSAERPARTSARRRRRRPLRRRRYRRS